jgi:hypothetical protein
MLNIPCMYRPTAGHARLCSFIQPHPQPTLALCVTTHPVARSPEQQRKADKSHYTQRQASASWDQGAINVGGDARAHPQHTSAFGAKIVGLADLTAVPPHGQ